MKQQVVADVPLMKKLISDYIPQANAAQQEQFVRYYDLLIDYNNRMNLTAITDPFGIVQRHFADSLLGAELIPSGAKCIDVGTGAGFPGIPLLIMRPDLKLTLLDSLNKRIAFLNDVAAELSLPCVAVHARAEDAGQNPELREKFDIALTRAVANVGMIAEWTLPFLKNGGCSLMYKGPGAADELRSAESALKCLNGTAVLREFEAEWGARSIVVVKKHGIMPKKYPRRPGIAAKNPL